MTRPWFRVYGADMTASDKWMETSPIARGALLTLWVYGSVKEIECGWKSRDAVAKLLSAQGFANAAETAAELVDLGWVDVNERGEASAHEWELWQTALPKTGSERTRDWRQGRSSPVTAGDGETSQASQPSHVTLGEERKGKEVPPSLRSGADAAAPARSEGEWLAYILEENPQGRMGRNGKKLSASAIKIARIGDYYAERLGRPFDDSKGGRLAALVDQYPIEDVLGAIGRMAMADPKGDPINYLTKTLSSRRNGGANRAAAAPSRPGADLDGIVFGAGGG